MRHKKLGGKAAIDRAWIRVRTDLERGDNIYIMYYMPARDPMFRQYQGGVNWRSYSSPLLLPISYPQNVALIDLSADLFCTNNL